MRTTSYLKGFGFNADDGHTLSDATKITAIGGFARLRPVLSHPLPGRPAWGFSTDADIYVRTAAFAPTARTAWGFVEAVGSQGLDEDGAVATSFGYRLHDGTDARYWDGAAWSVAGAGNWNTLADFNGNLGTYTGASLALEVNLVTTDRQVTPVLSRVRLLWLGEVVSSYREFIFDTLVPSLRNGVRPLVNFNVASDGTDEIDTPALFTDGLTVAGIVCAYDVTDDPDRATDLLDSFAAGVITLTAAPPEGNTIEVTASFAPDVAVTTSSLYTLEAKVPAIWITSISPRRSPRGLGGTGPHVLDQSLTPAAGTVWPQPVPLVDFDVNIAILAGGSLDLVALSEGLAMWMNAHPYLTSAKLAERVAVSAGLALDWSTANADEDDTRIALATLSLLNVPHYVDAAAIDADASGATAGPITAGDPDHPGVGYGGAHVRITWLLPTGASETTETP